MKTANVVSVGDVPAWVKSALETELRLAGVEVVDQSAAGQDVKVVDGEISRVYCDTSITYDASVFLKTNVTSPRGADLMHQMYMGRGSAGTVWAATSESYAKSLSLALQQAAKAFATDFVRLQP